MYMLLGNCLLTTSVQITLVTLQYHRNVFRQIMMFYFLQIILMKCHNFLTTNDIIQYICFVILAKSVTIPFISPSYSLGHALSLFIHLYYITYYIILCNLHKSMSWNCTLIQSYYLCITAPTFGCGVAA